MTVHLGNKKVMKGVTEDTVRKDIQWESTIKEIKKLKMKTTEETLQIFSG